MDPLFVWKMLGGLPPPSGLLKRSQVQPRWCQQGLPLLRCPPKDGPEVVAPSSLDDAGLESSHGPERVDAAELFPSEDGARIVGGIGSLKAVAQFLEVYLG